jgi:hypothetical protein
MKKRAKAPQDSWKKGRWMGFAHQCGDKFTYWIRTEKGETGQDNFPKRWTIKTRRKNIGRPTEYVNDDLIKAEFILLDRDHNRMDYDDDPDGLDPGELPPLPERPNEPPQSLDAPYEPSTPPDEPSEPSQQPDEPYEPSQPPDEPYEQSQPPDEPYAPSQQPDEPYEPSQQLPEDPYEPSTDTTFLLDSDEPAEEDNSIPRIDEKGQYIPETLETLYPGETPIVDELVTEDLADIYNQFQTEDEPGDEFEKVVDHAFTDGILLFKARYQGSTEGEHIVEIPFSVLKKDVPLECAKYIRNYVVDSTTQRAGTYTEWANKMLKQHTTTSRIWDRNQRSIRQEPPSTTEPNRQ